MPTRQMSQKVAVSVVYVAAMFMAIMDTTIVNVALPTIARDFHTDSAGVAATVIAFLVSLAVFIPASGWLGDHLGGRRVLLGAIVIFTAASALCGLASSLPMLVIFRVLQGVGGGLMTPVGLAMLFRVFPPAERMRATSVLVIPMTFAPALGPVVGGIFVSEVSWRWVFYVNVPIGIATVVFGYLFLADQRQSERRAFDLPGFVMSGVGLGLLMYGVSEGPTNGWLTAKILVTALGGLALLIGLVFYELRQEHPLLDLRIFENRLFRSTAVVMTLGTTAFIGVIFLLALFFQDGLGFSAIRSGFTIFPEAFGVMAGAQLVSRRLYPIFGPRRVMFAGIVMIALIMVALATVGVSTNLWLIRAIVFLLGFGVSGVFMPSQAASFATISHERTGGASTLFNVQRQLGGAIGVAVLTTVIVAVNPVQIIHGLPSVHIAAYHVAFLVAAAIALLGTFGALSINDADAAATMVRKTKKSAPSDEVDTPIGLVAIAPDTESVSG